jgi:hypothetical protein
MEALERLQLATLATILDIDAHWGNIDTPTRCADYALGRFVTVNDAAQACAIRMTLIEQREKGESGQATAGGGSQGSQADHRRRDLSQPRSRLAGLIPPRSHLAGRTITRRASRSWTGTQR